MESTNGSSSVDHRHVPRQQKVNDRVRQWCRRHLHVHQLHPPQRCAYPVGTQARLGTTTCAHVQVSSGVRCIRVSYTHAPRTRKHARAHLHPPRDPPKLRQSDRSHQVAFVFRQQLHPQLCQTAQQTFAHAFHPHRARVERTWCRSRDHRGTGLGAGRFVVPHIRKHALFRTCLRYRSDHLESVANGLLGLSSVLRSGTRTDSWALAPAVTAT